MLCQRRRQLLVPLLVLVLKVVVVVALAEQMRPTLEPIYGLANILSQAQAQMMNGTAGSLKVGRRVSSSKRHTFKGLLTSVFPHAEERYMPYWHYSRLYSSTQPMLLYQFPDLLRIRQNLLPGELLLRPDQ